MTFGKSVMIAFCSGGLLATGAAAEPISVPIAPAPQPVVQRGQALATVNAPLQLLGVPVHVTAPDPIYYTGSAYRNDISGQSESNSDPAIAEDARNAAPGHLDAW